jgi:hypothetical protein
MASGGRRGRQPQYLVAADQDERRGQAGRIAVKGQDVRVARVGAGEAKFDDTWRKFDRYQRVDSGVEPKRFAGQGEIG